MSDAAPAAAPATAPSTNGVSKAAPAKANGTTAAPPAKGATSGTGAPAQATESSTQPPASAEVDPLAQYLKTKGITVKRRDGREVRIETPEHLLTLASQGMGAAQEIEAARAAKAEAEAVRAKWEALKKDPRSVLRQELGEDTFREISTQEALDAYEAEMRMRGVPEHVQRELKEAKKLKLERDQLQAQQRAEMERRQQMQQQQELEAAHQWMLETGVGALKAVGFPEKPPAATILRAGQYVAEALDMGFSPEQAQQHAAALVKEDMAAEFQQMASGYLASNDVAGLEAWLGPKVTDALMRARVAKLRGAAAAPPSTQSATQPPAEGVKDEVAADPVKLRAWLRGR